MVPPVMWPGQQMLKKFSGDEITLMGLWPPDPQILWNQATIKEDTVPSSKCRIAGELNRGGGGDAQ
jgi:hypothetical protein